MKVYSSGSLVRLLTLSLARKGPAAREQSIVTADFSWCEQAQGKHYAVFLSPVRQG